MDLGNARGRARPLPTNALRTTPQWNAKLDSKHKMLCFVQVLRTMYMDLEKVADMVPVDYTVNAILVSAWHTAKNFKEKYGH